MNGGAVYVDTAFGGIYAIGGTDQGAVPAASSPATSASVAATIVETVATNEVTGASEATGPRQRPVRRSKTSGSRRAVRTAWRSRPRWRSTPKASYGSPTPATTGSRSSPPTASSSRRGAPEGTATANSSWSAATETATAQSPSPPTAASTSSTWATSRVQKFAADRTFVTSWGGFGQATRHLHRPDQHRRRCRGHGLRPRRRPRCRRKLRARRDGARIVRCPPRQQRRVQHGELARPRRGGNFYISDIDPLPDREVRPDGESCRNDRAARLQDGQFKDQPGAIAVDADGRCSSPKPRREGASRSSTPTASSSPVGVPKESSRSGSP